MPASAFTSIAGRASRVFCGKPSLARRLRYAWVTFCLRLEWRMHKVDVYLAAHREDWWFAADAASRAEECARRLTSIEINRRYEGG